MMTGEEHKRLHVRLSAEHKAVIERAAALLGQTVSAFTISTLVRKSEQVIKRFDIPCLTDRDRDVFLAALDNPPEPNARLRRAARSHAERVVR